MSTLHMTFPIPDAIEQKKTALMLAMPVVLTASTYAAFQLFDRWWGYPLGYLMGFAFYWIFWCLLFPTWVLGGARPVLALFQGEKTPFNRLGWKVHLLTWLWIAFPLFTIFIARAAAVGWAVLLVSVAIGIVIGVTEEILWRGVYLRLFPTSTWMNMIYPALMFGIWHISPQSVRSSSMPGGVFSFVFYAVLLGLAYAYSARKTGSIRWVTLSHIIHDSLGLGALAYAAWLGI